MAGRPRGGMGRLVVRAALSAGVFAATAVGGSVVAHGATTRPSVATKAPAGRAGELTAVSAVPHSSDAWVIDNDGSEDNAKYFIGRRHGGHLRQVKAPKLGGRCGLINTVAAGSASSVWLGGARQVSCQAGQLVSTAPVIWRLKGSKFVAAKLPKLDKANSSGVASISATSATNAWAVGGLYPGATAAQVAFHWNGKAWSAVTIPTAYAQGLYDVSTSGPSNAWALQSDYSTSEDSLVHWNGKAWTVTRTEPVGISLSSVATSSAKLAYAVGFRFDPTTGVTNKAIVLKYNGKTWSSVKVPKAAAHAGLSAVAMHGHSVWVIGSTASGRPVLLHSTGGSWKAVKSPGSGYQLLAVSSASSSHAFAVGEHRSGQSGTSTTYLAALSGSSWKSEPSKF
jgi:hypothetical protein